MAGLASLLPFVQSAMGGQVAAPDPNAVVQGDPILVNGTRPEFDRTQMEMLPSYQNRDVLEELAYTQEQAPERKGMFGVKGTLRDVIGTLGDAFLLQSGNEAIYRPQRQSEKVSDAMVGFAQGTPEQQLAAIERVANVNPAMAQKMVEAYGLMQHRAAQAQNTAGNNASLAADRQFGNLNDMSKFGANLLNGVRDEASLGYALNVIESRLPEGTSLEDLGLSRDMNLEEAQMYANSAINRSQQENIPLAQRRTATGEYNAQTSRMNAVTNRNRPRSRPRADTRNEDFQQAMAKDPKDRTEADLAIIAAGPTGTSTRSSGRSSSRSGRLQPVGGGQSTKFEGWDFKKN